MQRAVLYVCAGPLSVTAIGSSFAFPMFSPDGEKIVFCSNRNNGGTHDTNIFIADRVE